ncbi:BnaC08g04870D [Brassica napus]|uniref:(rape) hypothetical protein n=1 Tax=Brassica napus TaxID=3708 RepID=A0A078I0W5_BRANA|nr:unnamed protein product [Brassica napus]CDY43214.1 BnaC08g04870D [Brassica napus]
MHFPSDGMQIFDHDDRRFSCGYASGLIYFYGIVPVIFNPKTGRYETLPYISRTLGTRGMRWRKIECSLRVEIKSEGVCINGVLYYLGVIYNDDFTDDAIELRVWVLEDVEKQKWTKYAYTLRSDKLFPHYASEVGVISTSEIMLSMADYASKQPFYIYYFNPERNTIRRVEIQEEEYEDDKYGFRRFMVKRGRKQMEIKPSLTEPRINSPGWEQRMDATQLSLAMRQPSPLERIPQRSHKMTV